MGRSKARRERDREEKKAADAVAIKSLKVEEKKG